MTYGQLRDQVLKYINQYSVAGTVVETTYNNQQDYINRIPQLANDAMMEIATTVRKIQTSFKLQDALDEDMGDFVRYTLPTDFYQFKSGDTAITLDGKLLHTNLYQIFGKKYVVIPKTEADPEYAVTYYRYPKLLSDSPDDNMPLDNTVETHYAAALYVAGQLIYADDQSSGTKLINQYADRLANMTPDITAEVHPVEDVYGFSDYNFM